MIQLSIPKLININENDKVHIDINTGLYRFSSNAAQTGKKSNFPIFNSSISINNQLVNIMSYGLPFIKFKRNSRQNISFSNHTPYYFNIHFHGLNCTAYLDGTSYKAQFGAGTELGVTMNYQFHVFNNSMLSWMHPHVGMISSQLIYSGLYGIYEIVDDFSEQLDNYFDYEDNYLILVYSDLDLNLDGSVNNWRLNYNNWRGFNGMINGQVCLNWTLGNLWPFYTKSLYHKTSNNLFKISMLNGTPSFRTVYLAVCNKHNKPQPFYFIQTDCGFRNPFKTTILSISPAERVSIIFDLNDFEDGEVIISFYNFDLTYIFSTFENVYLNNKNKIVDMFNQEYNCGLNRIPGVQYFSNTYELKPFLYIKNTSNNKNNFYGEKLETCLKIIQKIVFGSNFQVLNLNSEKLLNKKYFHYLNEKYYYNLPDFKNAPTRQVIFNMLSYPNKGVSDWINMAPKVFSDMWNSYEYEQWVKTRSDKYLPSCLFIITGQSKYINYKKFECNHLTIEINNLFNNLQTIVIEFPVTNEPLNIKQWIELVNSCYKKVKLDLPNKKYKYLSDILDLDWTDFLLENYYLWNNESTYKNSIFIKTVLMKNQNKSEYKIKLTANYRLLQFFGKCIGATLPGRNMIMVKDIPLKKYGIIGNTGQFFGMWGVMILFMLVGMYIGMQLASKISIWLMVGNMKLMMKVGMYIGMYSFMSLDMGFTRITTIFLNMIMLGIFLFFIFYYKNMSLIPIISGIVITILVYLIIYILPMRKRNNANMQKLHLTQGDKQGFNILLHKNEFPSINIDANSTYTGIVDGYMNDNLMNFSVKKNSTEKWLFTNLDTNNAHPLHFHLTSGYADVDEQNNCLSNKQFNHLLYSKDIYSIGIQQTLPFYLKFSNYDSSQGKIKNLGYFYHCHFMLHHDLNMMGQYYVHD